MIAPLLEPGRTRIAHAVPGAWLPQTETWLYRQVRSLPAGIESHVMCERAENLDQFAVENLHHAGRGRRTRDRVLAKLRLRRRSGSLLRRLRDVRPQLVHSHFAPEGWRNIPAAGDIGARHVVSFYGYDVSHLPAVSRTWRRRYRELFDRVDLVLCEGEHMGRSIAGLGCPASKVQVHRLGVDLEAIEFRPRQWNGVEPLQVLLAASFRPKKGLTYAIEALAMLQDDIDLQITIIGDATAAPGSTDEKQRILDAIDRHGLGPRVRMLGFQPHDRLFEEASGHHLYVAPSVTDADGDTEGGAPVALIEMVAGGMPVVSTHHCDIPGVVRDGISGYLAAEHDVEDLREQIRRTIDAAPRWPEMLRAGRVRVEERFDAAAQGARLGALYREVIDGVG